MCAKMGDLRLRNSPLKTFFNTSTPTDFSESKPSLESPQAPPRTLDEWWRCVLRSWGAKGARTKHFGGLDVEI